MTKAIINSVNINNDIIFKNVNFKYENSDSTVLNNINLTIKTGEFVALVGMSGCGKSTLVNLIPRLYNPISGKITIDNVDINDFSLDLLEIILVMLVKIQFYLMIQLEIIYLMDKIIFQIKISIKLLNNLMLKILLMICQTE